MNAAKLGRLVAQRRRKAGLTQAELAERMGTKQPVISKIESGGELPTIPMLERIARATGEPFSLTFGVDEKTTPEERRRRVLRVTRGYVFNPWDRDPTPAEARTLERDGD
jgi:transcriptional regulator with XRE-family HTH domain